VIVKKGVSEHTKTPEACLGRRTDFCLSTKGSLCEAYLSGVTMLPWAPRGKLSGKDEVGPTLIVSVEALRRKASSGGLISSCKKRKTANLGRERERRKDQEYSSKTCQGKKLLVSGGGGHDERIPKVVTKN